MGTVVIPRLSGRPARKAGAGGGLSPREKARKKKLIRAEVEARKIEMGAGGAPGFRRGPVFYLALVVGMALLGMMVIKATDDSPVAAKVRTGKMVMAGKSVEAFAEALGRFKFHTGVYPAAEEGLAALVEKRSRHAGWVGPYIHAMCLDPWKRAYVYEPPADPEGLPTLLSCGPDGVRGTADDIVPDAALFTKPFRDTTWTNDWAPFYERGIIVVPSHAKRKEAAK